MAEQTEKKLFDWQLLKRIINLAAPFRRQFIIALSLSVLLAIIAPIRPYLIQVTVDRDIMNLNLPGLVNMTFILIAILIGETFLRYYFSYLTGWLGQSVIKNLRSNVFQHIIQLRLKFFDKTPIGTITTRTINDVEAINDVFSEGIIAIISDLLTIVTIIAIMTYTDWKLTLVSLATFPLIIYSTYVFKEAVNDSFTRVRNQVAKLNAFLQEHISGMRIIQIFNAEEQEMKKFIAINDEHKKAHIDSIFYYAVFFPVVEVILAIALGLMVWYGANSVIKLETSLGVLIAFILYLNMLFRPLRFLADKFNTLQMGLVAADRVFKVLDNDDVTENSGTLRDGKLKGNLEFRNVWFAYAKEDYVLRDISFEVKAGQTLAIVGATGSGKSTIINIINRFYEFNKGNVLIDGNDIRQYELTYLRSHIGLVLQDVFLFSGSVYDNITLRDHSVSKEKVMEAAKLVGAHDFIMRLPGGYDYNVMERGATLSMGQRQLISFIRALVFNPSILILDEATSSIDTESEELIQHAIEKLITGRTSIVIAHRLSTIQYANKILVLDKGELKESGTHDELLAKKGYYSKLHEMQFNTNAPKPETEDEAVKVPLVKTRTEGGMF
jgi:ATP-binding cassette, subfamily B, multidrug efflux pump